MKYKLTFVNCSTLDEIARGYLLYSINREIIEKLKIQTEKKILLEDDIFIFKKSKTAITITRKGV